MQRRMDMNPWVQKSYERTTTQPAMPDQTLNLSADSSSSDVMNQLLQASIRGIGEQRNQLDEIKGYKDKVQNYDQKMDLTGLMMLSDAWGGTNFQQNYERPVNQMERDAMILQSDKDILSGYQSVADDEVNALKNLLSYRMDKENQKEGSVKDNLLPGQVAMDKEFGKAMAKDFGSGNIANLQNNRQIIGQSLQKLKDAEAQGDPLTGTWKQYAPLGRSVFDRESFGIQSEIESVVQQSLRETLGAQFTEKEGARLIERAFNPKMPAEYNERRLNALFTALDRAMRIKQEAMDHFRKTGGTLLGFEGSQTEAAIRREMENLVLNFESTGNQRPSGEGKKQENRPPSEPKDAPAEAPKGPSREDMINELRGL